jgi:hypothetical protein
MSTLAERVLFLCDAAALPRVRLSKLCGLAGSHLGLIVAGHHASVRGDLAARIAKVFGCSLEWLITGEGQAPDAAHVRASVVALEPARESEGEEGAA